MKTFITRLIYPAVFLAVFPALGKNGLFLSLLGLFFGVGVGLFSPFFFGGARKLFLPLSAAFGLAAGFPGAVVWLGLGMIFCRIVRRFRIPFPEEAALFAALLGTWGVLSLLG